MELLDYDIVGMFIRRSCTGFEFLQSIEKYDGSNHR